MNITVGDGEVQEYDDLAGLDSSSAWEVYMGSTDDFGVVGLNKDHESLDLPFADQDVVNSQWSSTSSSFAIQQQRQSSSPACTAPGATTEGGCRTRSIRDILREVKVSEETLQSAVARLGGGAQGLQVLMDHVYFWASSSEACDTDVTTTIRKGIVDLGNMPPYHGAFNAHLQWKHYSNHGTTGCESSHRGPAYTRALRKSHIVRQRKHPPRAQRMSKQPDQYGHHPRGQWRSGAPHQSWLQDDLDPGLGHDANGKGYEFLFQKELRASDVSSLGRIVLPKKDAERHLPFLVVREGMLISFEDYQSGTFWTARYRFWPNNKSRMYLLENIGGFVTFHHLQEGDFLLCYRNRQGGYVIRGRKVPEIMRDPAKGPNPRDTTPEKESTETTSEKETATNTTTQFMDGDQSITNTTERDSSSFDSLECSFSDGPSNRSIGRQQTGSNRYVTHNDEMLLCEFDPAVEMLSVSNVKQRYTDGKEALQPE